MNVWNPQVQQYNEFSLSQIWLLGGSFASDLNSIEAGWQVTLFLSPMEKLITFSSFFKVKYHGRTHEMKVLQS